MFSNIFKIYYGSKLFSEKSLDIDASGLGNQDFRMSIIYNLLGGDEKTI